MLHFLVAAAIIGASPAMAPPPDQPAPIAATAVAPGDPAPPFTLKGSDGRTYRLQDYRGKRAVVVAWFPKAFTAG
jgi:peroxiredoxin